MLILTSDLCACFFCVLKSQENDELRDAHEKRKERLQMLQTNYRAVKEQLKQWEEGSGM